MVDFPNVLSKFLMLGMPLDQVLARGTATPRGLFPAFKGLGTLAVGAPADVTVLEMREGRFEFVDNFDGQANRHDRRLVASGHVLRRQARLGGTLRRCPLGRGRCDAIEECYEFMLAYAAQGLSGDASQPNAVQLRALLTRGRSCPGRPRRVRFARPWLTRP